MRQKFGSFGSGRASYYKRRRMMFVGGSTAAIAIAILASLLVYGESSVDAKPVMSSAEHEEGFLGTVKLYAPRNQISRGSKLDVSSLIEVRWPREQVPAGAIRSQYDVQDMFATVSLSQGQPIVKTNLSPNPLVNSIAERLPKGYRAITIKVDAVSGVEGWARPGAHVDVQLTYLDREEQINKTRVVVEDAIVLSYGGDAKTPQGESKKRYVGSRSTTTATLAVSAKDSLGIQSAQASGRITLALRNPTDVKSSGIVVFDPKEEWKDRKQAKKKGLASTGFAEIDGRQLILNQGEWFISEDDDE